MAQFIGQFVETVVGAQQPQVHQFLECVCVNLKAVVDIRPGQAQSAFWWG